VERLLAYKPGAFVDLGVNVGQTLLKVKTRRPDVRYIGFEPNLACCEYVRRLIAANRFESCTVVPAGLYDRPAILELYLRGDSDVAGSVIEGFRPASYYTNVRHVVVLPGDLMLDRLNVDAISVLKVDVEGAELEALEGLRRTLERRPFVLCEILGLIAPHSTRFAVRKPRQDRLLALMRELGFDLYRMLGERRVIPLDGIEVHSDVALSNYLFAPREERDFVGATFAVAPGSMTSAAMTSTPL
jgi:FkbM family methyltransferase